MDNIVTLADRRDAQYEGDPPAICPCGSWWFELIGTQEGAPPHGAITLRRDGTVSGYNGIPHCRECGKPHVY